MALDNAAIQTAIQDQFNSATGDFRQIHDILTFEVQRESVFEVIKYLKENGTLRFNFLTDICGMHMPEATPDRQFAVVYHMHNWLDNVRIRIKSFLPAENPEIDSIVELFAGANWQERETYDFYGITFKGHPQLKRILNMDEMTSFPMRREFPLEDGGRTDKDDRFFGRTTDNSQPCQI